MNAKLLLPALLLAALPAFGQVADEEVFGSWVVAPNKNGLLAMTRNDSGAVLGEACFMSSKECQWRILLDLKCDEGDKYAILANTDSGAAHLEFICNGSAGDGQYLYVFANWKELEGLLKTATRVGFAMPLQGDRFSVYRFDLNGMKRATERLEKVFFGMVEQRLPPPSRMKDTTTQTL